MRGSIRVILYHARTVAKKIYNKKKEVKEKKLASSKLKAKAEERMVLMILDFSLTHSHY